MIPTDRNHIFQNDIEKIETIINFYPIIRLYQESLWNDKY